MTNITPQPIRHLPPLPWRGGGGMGCVSGDDMTAIPAQEAGDESVLGGEKAPQVEGLS
jgi:hypothetical protein